MKIKELPLSERPYEKLEIYGAEKLSNAELLAIIIKNGTKEESAVNIAQRVLSLNQSTEYENIRFLQDVSIKEFMGIKGIGKVKAIQLKAVCELTKRISRPINKTAKVNNTKELADLLMPELRYEKREIVKLVLLNNKNVIMKIIDISLGRSKFCMYRAKRCLKRSSKRRSTKDNFSS